MKEPMPAESQQAEKKNKHEELMRNQVELLRKRACQRYATQDAYTITELTRLYDREDIRGRIRLLRRVYRQTPRLPYELALKAVGDIDSSVREWMARNGQMLDYQEARLRRKNDGSEASNMTESTAHHDSDGNLVDRLRNDVDPFVRAAFFENAELFSSLVSSQYWIDWFNKCSLLERLAMMRNEGLDFNLVKMILDPDNTDLGVEWSEKIHLAKACLVNRRVVENGLRTRHGYVPAEGLSSWGQSTDYSQAVWELAAKWPDPVIPFLAFHTIQTFDWVKARIYPTLGEAQLRWAILESCLPEDKETLRVARSDADQSLRSGAYSRSRWMDREEIEGALLREMGEKDSGAIDGLLTNPWLQPIAREILEAMSES